ncbi:MAG: hypothetical protein H6658_12215 [Ardenticatenaceae bacterium]|nr:hypothetical protein [Ardenticatenaceae bacterium]
MREIRDWRLGIRNYQSPISSLLFALLFLAACSPPPTAPLPTVAVAAALPAATSTAVPIPPTFTALPEHYATATYTPTATPTITPSPTPTIPATPTPTHFPVPDFLTVIESDLPFLEIPPAATDCDGKGLVFRSQFASEIGDPLVNYHAYLPPCYGQDGRSYPTLILLHAADETDSQWVDLGLAQVADEGIADGRYPPFIVLMPHLGQLGRTTAGGADSAEGLILNEFMPYVDSTFCAWGDARSIGGIGRGAYWALMMALGQEGVFTAVAAHSSQLTDSSDDAQYSPLATYATANLSQLRIWLDWGENDQVQSGSQALASALAEANIPFEQHLFGGGHNARYWQVHVRDYLDWHTAVWPKERDNYPPC